MMNNLFSTFDPTTSIFSMNWLILPLMIFIFPMNYYKNLYPLIFLFFKIITMLLKEFSSIMAKSAVQGMMNIIMSLFLFIIFSNSFGLYPFIFTSTSHLMITLMMAFSMWISFMLFMMMKQMKLFFAHLVPMGTPMALMMFMVLIETVSMLIRPITLSVRLSANMIAGHLLLSLLGNNFFLVNFSYWAVLYIAQILLLTLEMAVAMIQAYVFTMLIILYSMEV